MKCEVLDLSNALLTVERCRVVATIGAFFPQVIILRQTPSLSDPRRGFSFQALDKRNGPAGGAPGRLFDR